MEYPDRQIGDYMIRTTLPYQNIVEFLVWRQIGNMGDGSPLYGSDISEAGLADPENLFCRATVKWDGCLEVSYRDPHQHFCIPEHVEAQLAMLKGLWDLARPLMADAIF